MIITEGRVCLEGCRVYNKCAKLITAQHSSPFFRSDGGFDKGSGHDESVGEMPMNGNPP